MRPAEITCCCMYLMHLVPSTPAAPGAPLLSASTQRQTQLRSSNAHPASQPAAAFKAQPHVKPVLPHCTGSTSRVPDDGRDSCGEAAWRAPSQPRVACATRAAQAARRGAGRTGAVRGA